MKIIKVEAEIIIPKVPNFLIIDNDNKISIADVPDGDLKRVGAEWIKNLITRKKRILMKRPDKIRSQNDF